jgi:hypothetical protein
MKSRQVSAYAISRLNECLPVICSFWGVTPKQVLGKSRIRNIINAKHSLRYFLMMSKDLSLGEVGALTDTDHATVLHSKRTFEVLCEYDIKYQQIKAIMLGDLDALKDISTECLLTNVIISGLSLKQKVDKIKEIYENK